MTYIARYAKGPKLRGPLAENVPQVPRAENFGYLIAADHKVPKECELRNSHRYEMIVQALAAQW